MASLKAQEGEAGLSETGCIFRTKGVKVILLVDTNVFGKWGAWVLHMFYNKHLGERYSALFLFSLLISHVVLVLKRIKQRVVVAALRVNFSFGYAAEEAKELEWFSILVLYVHSEFGFVVWMSLYDLFKHFHRFLNFYSVIFSAGSYPEVGLEYGEGFVAKNWKVVFLI